MVTPDLPPPPAVHVSIVLPDEKVDHDRVLKAILQLEGTPWSKPGGAYCFQPASWREETSLPYRLASNPAQATIIAKIRLARFHAICAHRGIRWTATLAGDAWRWGIEEAIRKWARNKPSGYGQRVKNLHDDETFEPSLNREIPIK